jgi:oligopeptide transport system ATP-binding protein
LQRSIPSLQPKGRELYTIPGLPPDLSKPAAGCAFAPRCEHAVEHCRVNDPRLVAVTAGQATACLRVQAGEI